MRLLSEMNFFDRRSRRPHTHPGYPPFHNLAIVNGQVHGSLYFCEEDGYFTTIGSNRSIYYHARAIMGKTLRSFPERPPPEQFRNLHCDLTLVESLLRLCSKTAGKLKKNKCCEDFHLVTGALASPWWTRPARRPRKPAGGAW